MRSLTRLCCALAVALPLVLTLLPPRGAKAAGFTVNSLADTPDAVIADGVCADASGACTLRAAIEQANADLSADTIGIAVNGTINLTGPLPGLSTNVTINGPGSSLLTVRRDTGGDYRIFTVGAATVAISGLTVSNGQAQPGGLFFSVGGEGSPGGGISNIGDLTLTGCVISGNASGVGGPGFPLNGNAINGGGGHGGGLYNEGRLTMTGCAVSNNRATGGTVLDITSPSGVSSPGGAGGGIANSGTLTMTDCSVTGNSTGGGNTVFKDGDAGPGGGIANLDIGNGFRVGVATLTNCNVTDNRTGNGVGMGTDSNNNASSPGGHGGGIFNGATMTLVKSSVGRNATGKGADARRGVVSTAGSGGNGGGVYNTGTLTMTNGVVTGNSTGTGGASSEVNCSRGDGGNGGGIASPSGTLKLSQCTIMFNQTGLLGEPCGRDGVGGGLYGAGKLRSTIVSNNFVRFPGTAREVTGTGAGFESFGYNYIGIGAGCCFTATDRHGSLSAPGFNLNLDPATLIPLPGGLALDAGLARDVDDQPVDTDRRGAARPFDDPSIPPASGGDNSEIGAFERQATDPTPTPTPAPPTVQFTAATSSVAEGCVQTEVTVTRTGPKDFPTVATYVVTDQTAFQRGDFTRTTGRIAFSMGVDTQTIPVLISEDAYAEGTEELIVSLTSVTGGQLGTPSSVRVQILDNDTADGAANPIDDDATFVGQHYHDFLSRQADPDGQAFWTNELAACNGDAGCLDRKRVDVSAAFFLSIEFQNTGYFVIRTNKAAFGNQPGNPRYIPFLDETQEVGSRLVVGQPFWENLLDDSKRGYLERFVGRGDFTTAHGNQNAEQYVDSLFANTGATPTQAERDAALSAFGTGDSVGRARALRSVVESGSVYNKLYNPAFVLMQYFAYLRRNPDAAPDNNFGGYDFWLSKLDQFTAPGEDARDERVALSRVRRAEMVRAFLLSAEYRGRFQGDPNRGS